MIISLAPMEGLTGHVFRRVHARHFGPLDRYYTPFLAPPRVGSRFGRRHAAELDISSRDGLEVVPQLLTNNLDEFVWASRLLADMGYGEVNFNAGCPSKTVVGKGKGAGFLRDVSNIEGFLLGACERSCLPVSVKTRLGIASEEEFDGILAAYCRCPLSELIVHPRVQRDFYRGRPCLVAYATALELAPFPVAYNGDIFSVDDMDDLLSRFPKTNHVMLGRGLLANPALARELRGGDALSLAELQDFHDDLTLEYEREMGDNAAFAMKEWWHYGRCCFDRPDEVHRLVREVRSMAEYRQAASRVFDEFELSEYPHFR